MKPVPVRDPALDRKRLGIPDALGSCHTGVVNGYVLEGHVPAREIRKLLRDKPAALGLSVPAMPRGSPGMETPRNDRDPYDVLLVQRGGKYAVYASYR